ncbi:MAG: hypothetical protein QOG10_3732 [Kribbellaceae bacterium]|nr:hypothetical protein [Kribbellaceae bacterium]
MQQRSVDQLARWVSVLGAIALGIALLGVGIFVDTRYQRAVGREFLADGVETVATEVQLHIESGKGGRYVAEVEVVFPVATGGRQRTMLVNNLGDDEGGGLGWRQPGPATRYAPPLTILYKPEDPSQAIALVDARYFAIDTETPAVALGMIVFGLTIAALVGVCLSLNARRRGRRWWSWHAGRHRRH